MLAPLLAGITPRRLDDTVLPLGNAADDVSPWMHEALRRGARHWVANVDAQVEAVTVGSTCVPLTILRGPPAQSAYVASLHAAWISYACAEIAAGTGRWRSLQSAGANLLAAPLAGLMAVGGLHRAAVVGNHLLSTNLHPAWSSEDIARTTAALTAVCPTRPLALRNVCPAVDAGLVEALTTNGWELVPARRIYVVDPRTPAVWRHNHLKRDRKLLHAKDLELAGPDDIPAEELPTLRALFRQLFLGKHCALNPDFTDAFFRLCHDQRFLDLYALRLDGRAVGVLGVLERDGWVTTPLIGYDTTLPQQLGIYRRLMALLFEEAQRRGCRLHLSSGAGGFKAARGGEAHLESTAVYTRHLPSWRRAAACTFTGLMRRYAPAVLERTG